MPVVDDLRGWLEKVDSQGLLRRVEGAEWEGEIGALSALNARDKANPALLFDHINGYPPGYRVLTCSTHNAGTLAITFGLTSPHSDWELVDIFRERFSQWEADWQKFPPKAVKTGPVLENVHSGEEVNLLEFPAPKWHEDDGGRYIGTGDAVISQDPETGEVNLGTYRIMVHDAHTVGLYAAHGRHVRDHCDKYHSQGKPCPIAISVGHHPLFFRAASLRFPPGSEYGFIGAVRGQPVDVIREEVTGLPIPANSEIVIAGWCPPGKLKEEGPFGEFTGYYGSGHFEGKSSVIEIERVYHRRDPVILGAPPNAIYYDSSYPNAIIRSARLHNNLEENGVPVRRVWFNEAVGGGGLTIVSIKQEYAGHARRAALVASQFDTGIWVTRFVVVVDEDIDPMNIDEVLWAMCTRLEPEKDIQILPRLRGTPIDPLVRKPAKTYYRSMAILDACKPYEWIGEFPRAIGISPELMARVKKKWGGVPGL